MSIKLMSSIWDNESLDITNVEQSVLLKLADYGNDDGISIYPSWSTLSKKLRLSKMTISRAINTLESKHLLTRASKESKFGTNEYTLNARKILELKVCGITEAPVLATSNTELPQVVTESYQGGNTELHKPLDKPLVKPLDICAPAAHSPLSPSKSSKKNKKERLEKHFEMLWDIYPSKKGKASAYKAFKKEVGTLDAKELDETVEAIRIAIWAHRQEDRWALEVREAEPKWDVFYPAFPLGSTWFTQKRWLDTYETNPEIFYEYLKKQAKRSY